MTSPQNGQTTDERFDEIEHVICSLVNLRSRGTRVETIDVMCSSVIPEIEKYYWGNPYVSAQRTCELT